MRRGGGTRPLQFSEKEIQIGAMRSGSDDYQIRAGVGDEEQRKEDERDIDWIFSFVVSLYLCDR